MKTISFDGPCPFLMCLKTDPHEHPVCPECDAVRFGNMNCKTCRENRDYINKEIEESLKILKEKEAT